MNTLLKLLTFILIILSVITLEYYEDTIEALKSYPNQVKKGGKNPKYLYFKMKKNLPRGIDYYTKIFYAFLNTAGMRPYFVNLKDETLLGLIPEDANIDQSGIEEIKQRFEDIVDDVFLKFSLKNTTDI
jgi:hypothetical protein